MGLPLLLSLAASGAAGAEPAAGGAPGGPRIVRIAASAETVELYATLELVIDVAAAYENPYDPAEVAVEGLFTSPAGREVRVNGFFYRDFTRVSDAGGVAIPRNEAGWRMRFTPDEPGHWRYQVAVRDRSGVTRSAEQAFIAGPPSMASDADPPGGRSGRSPRHGFLRVRPPSPYFTFDDGTPFFAIGENMGWWGGQPGDYDRWLTKLAAAGGNFIRVWMASWSFGIEWNDTGLGNYDRRQERAFQLDHLFDLADRLGVAIVLVLNNHGQFSARTNPEWERNPYNAANGGMLSQPAGFFSDPAAKSLFQRRLRYIVARWGHHPSLLAWELWNEVDLTDGYNSAAVAAWHREMAAFLREIDPYDHLITTSFSRSEGDPAVWQLSGLDFTNTHFYGGADMAAVVLHHNRDRRAHYEKPTFVAEFGHDWRGPGGEKDPTGISLHNGLWAGLFSPSAGTAMLWWWDNYVDPYNLYGRFAGLSGFLEGIAWQADDLRPFEPVVETSRRGDLSISPTLGWAGRPASTRFTVAGGRLTGPSDVAGYLYGRRYNTQYRAAAPVTFAIDAAAPTSVAVTVAVAARSGAELVIEVDGRRALAVPFLPAAADIAVERAYRVEVPAGRHVVTIDNAGTDWLQIGGYAIGGAVPQIRPLGLIGSRPAAGGASPASKSIALVWLQDRQHTWTNVHTGYQPVLIDDARVGLDGLIPGRYRYMWWDPWAARAVASADVEVGADGRLVLAVPPFRRDLALRLTAEPRM